MIKKLTFLFKVLFITILLVGAKAPTGVLAYNVSFKGEDGSRLFVQGVGTYDSPAEFTTDNDSITVSYTGTKQVVGYVLDESSTPVSVFSVNDPIQLTNSEIDLHIYPIFSDRTYMGNGTSVDHLPDDILTQVNSLHGIDSPSDTQQPTDTPSENTTTPSEDTTTQPESSSEIYLEIRGAYNVTSSQLEFLDKDGKKLTSNIIKSSASFIYLPTVNILDASIGDFKGYKLIDRETGEQVKLPGTPEGFYPSGQSFVLKKQYFLEPQILQIANIPNSITFYTQGKGKAIYNDQTSDDTGKLVIDTSNLNGIFTVPDFSPNEGVTFTGWSNQGNTVSIQPGESINLSEATYSRVTNWYAQFNDETQENEYEQQRSWDQSKYLAGVARAMQTSNKFWEQSNDATQPLLSNLGPLVPSWYVKQDDLTNPDNVKNYDTNDFYEVMHNGTNMMGSDRAGIIANIAALLSKTHGTPDAYYHKVETFQPDKLAGSNEYKVEESQADIDKLMEELEQENNTDFAYRAKAMHSRIFVLTSAIFEASSPRASNAKEIASSYPMDVCKNEPMYMNEYPIMLIYDGIVGSAKVQNTDQDIWQALNDTIMEWGTYATEWRESLIDTMNDTDYEGLSSLNETIVHYGEAYPQLNAAWTWKGVNGDEPSLKDLFETFTHTEDEPEETWKGTSLVKTQPLEMFFTTHTLGIDNAVTGVGTPWDWFYNEKNTTPPLELSENMKEGISYSAAYVPMQTNVYAANIINDMDKTFREKFHYKYGFMRKAVYIDKAADSVRNYYNTDGNRQSNIDVCTLSDLLNSKGDVILYIDDDFYNSDQLPNLYEKRVAGHKSRVNAAYDAYERFYYGAAGIDETTDSTGSGLTISDNNYTSGPTANARAWEAFCKVTGMSNDASVVDGMQLTLKAIIDKRKDTYTVPTDELLKDNDSTTYDSKLRQVISEQEDSMPFHDGDYVDTDIDEIAYNNADMYVLSSYDIKDILSAMTTRLEKGPDSSLYDWNYTTYNDYTPLFSYAYVSAIYRNGQDYTLLWDGTSYSPIFMASEKLSLLANDDPEVTQTLKNTLYNYALLKNLDSMSQLTYSYSLDMDSPLYTDVYGNILTASGIVVIPAASNATLWAANWCNYQPGIGLYSCYGNSYYIPTNIGSTTLSTCFGSDETGQFWLPISRYTGNLDYAHLDMYSEESGADAVAYFKEYLNQDTNINWWAYAGIISETMRGAPVDYIDLAKEGLTSSNLNAEGLVLAAKLESLIDNLKGSGTENAMFAIPDFTRMEHLNYWIAFIVKILAVITIGVVIVTVYRDGAAGQIGGRTLVKTLSAVFLTFLSVSMIPAIFQFTYYGANKLLLQREAERIALFSVEKYQSGVEVGVTKTTVPTNDNDLMVQLDWINIPWYAYIEEIVTGDALHNIETVREDSFKASLVAHEPDVKIYNDGVYMSVNDIMDSTSIDYSFGSELSNVINDGSVSQNTVENIVTPDNNSVSSNGVRYELNGAKSLYMYNNSDVQTLSYYSPYYVFLYALVDNINQFNAGNGTYSYTTKYMSGSRLKTVGVCSSYFESPYFMETNTDIFHLFEVLQIPPEITEYSYDLFTPDQIAKMQESYWYNNQLDEPDTYVRVNKMNDYARDFVARNKDLLHKISDETFIKIMALSCSMYYNQIYGISEANCFEMYNLDATDLLRLSICKSDTAMLASPLSYARYVYTYGGEIAVYAAAALVMVMWIGAFIKPLCTVLVFISVFLSIFVFKVVLRKPGGMLGYVLTCVFLCITNFVHALLLKFSTYLPYLNIPTAACLILITIGQIFYLLLLANITAIAVRDWQDLGSEQYRADARYVRNVMKGETAQVLNANIKKHDNNWDYYNDLTNNYRERNQ